jgi:hypothetical protein
MKELLQAVVDKNFPLFEEVANKALGARVKVILEGYRPIAVNKFLAESENLSRHKGGEYVFEDGSYTDVPKETVKGIFEGTVNEGVNNAPEYAILAALSALALATGAKMHREANELEANPPTKQVEIQPHDGNDSVKVHPDWIHHMKESLDYFVSASKKNYDAYLADPVGILEALAESDHVLPHAAAKEALFEDMRSAPVLKTLNEMIEESWANTPEEHNEGDHVIHKGNGRTGQISYRDKNENVAKVRWYGDDGPKYTNENISSLRLTKHDR